jgi:DNA-binding transcriptional LysR family regulator
MEAFVRSVELGSFSAAARELKFTPSALSKLITRLERSLKVPLVYRTTRRISPTPEGELFLVRCRRILAEMEDAEMEVAKSREQPRGRLRMHLGVGLATHLIVPALPKFLQRYPDVQVDLCVEDTLVDIVRENIDISVWQAVSETASMAVRKLFEFERVVCASPTYLKRHGTPLTPDDLRRHRSLSVSSVPNHTQWPFQTREGKRVIEMLPRARANNVDCVYRFALAGMGIVRLAEYIVADALRDGGLVKVLADYHWPEQLAITAVYPQERHRLPRVAAMLDFLTATFKNRPWRAARFSR